VRSLDILWFPGAIYKHRWILSDVLNRPWKQQRTRTRLTPPPDAKDER